MSTSPGKQPPSPFKRQNSLPKRQNSLPKTQNALPKRQNSMSPMKRRENATPFTLTDEDLAPRRNNRIFGVMLQMVNISLLAFCVYRLQFSPPPAAIQPTPSSEIKLGVSLSSWDIAAASNLNPKPYVPRMSATCQLDTIDAASKDGSVLATWPVCTDHMPRNSTVYSFGVVADRSFNVEMIRRGNRVYAFDPSVDPEEATAVFRPNKERLLIKFSFMQVGLGKENGVSPFPTGQKAVAGFEGPVLTLQTLMTALGHDHIDVLKIGAGGAGSDVCTSPGFQSALDKVGQVILKIQESKVRGVQCLKLIGEKGFRLVESTNAGQHLFARVTSDAKVTKLRKRTFLR